MKHTSSSITDQTGPRWGVQGLYCCFARKLAEPPPPPPHTSTRIPKWVVVKIMVPFGVLNLIFKDPKRDHNFDNHPNGARTRPHRTVTATISQPTVAEPKALQPQTSLPSTGETSGAWLHFRWRTLYTLHPGEHHGCHTRVWAFRLIGFRS